MYHYVYYSYEEWGRGYIGVRSCKCLPEEDVKYFGSFKDKTFKPTHKIILLTFETRKEANRAEIILHAAFDVARDPYFANKANAYADGFALPGPQSEEHVEKKRQSLLKFKDENPEIFEEQQRKRVEAKKKWEQENPDKVKQNRSRAGKKAMEHLKSIPGAREKGLQKSYQYFQENPEAMSARGRKGCATTNKQRWQCTVTGYISNSGALTHYQRARGIDTSNRIKLPDTSGIYTNPQPDTQP